MIIQKQYKFYAAHRNETLNDKCRNLHGHRYGLRCHFEVQRDGDISTLFGDCDAKIEPWLKDNYDHGMLINVDDPLYESLLQHMARTVEKLRLKVLRGATSIENLCHMLFTEITQMGFRLALLEVQETNTSTILCSHDYWLADNRILARQQASFSQQLVSME